MFTKRKLSLILFLCLTSILVITGCSKPQQSIIPTLEDNSASGALNYGEEEMLEVVSAQIDLEVGGVIEITDETSEIYGTRLVIDPIDKERSIKELGTAEIAIIIDQMVTATNKMVDSQGFLITPVGTKANIIDFLTGRLEIFYNRDKLSNSGVSKDSDVNVYRVLCTVDPTAAPVPVPVPFVSWEKVPVEKITHVENMVSIEIGIGDLLYLYALTVTNCIPPSNLGKPLPGDLVYRLSKRGVNDNWLPGHVGIYVGEKYHEKEGLYNVIEAIGISPNKVVRSYYSDITSFGSGPPTYMGAREPINQSLTHITRNRIVEYVEKMVGMPYAVVETFGVYFGWARGENVKGPGSYNCVGLAEAAYESVGIDIVSNKDEGNDLDPNHPDALLSPQEQLFSTVPASGVIDQNIAPEISSLAITPEGFIETNSLVYITCNASDSDQDELTYIWTIPEYGRFVTFIKGKSISLSAPDKEGIYEISCKVIDNYGGEDNNSVNISVGGSITNQVPVIISNPVTSATKDIPYSYDVNATDPDEDTLTYSLTAIPNGMTINSLTGLISWTPSSIGSYNVTVKVSDGELFAAQDFTVIVEEAGTTNKPNPPTSLSPGSTSAPGPIISSLTPALSWAAVPNTDYYNLSVSIYPYGSSNIIFYNQQVYGNSITIPSGKLEEGQKYRWNIRAYNSAGYSDYSSDYYFQTESTSQVPLPPTGLSVSSYWNTTSPGFPSMTISWNAVSGATGYEMYVRPSGGSSTYLGTRDAPYVSFNSNSLPGGTRYVSGSTYYFKVRTITASGTSAFTSEVSCIAASGSSITPPNPPTSLSPGSTSAPGPIISSLTPALSWAAVPNTDYYNLSVSIYPYGTSNIIFYNQQVYGNSITIPSGKLEEGQKYRWNIRAYNSAGYSDYSSDYYFQTESTQEVTLTLYLYENSLSGPPLSGVSVGVVDGGGTSSNHITNSSGYLTVKGIPGTWFFSAMKSGYDTNNWSQPITTNCTKYGYLVKSAIPVGTIDVSATLDGSPWIGSLSYSLTGPSPSSGSTVPAVLNNKPIGTYSISYNSGGPSNAIVSSITPSSTQTLSTGSIIAFTFNFVSQAPSLGQAQLLSPSSGSSLPPMNVTFIWNSVSNATKYQFILYNSQGQVALDKIYTSTNVIVSLGTIETITWKVRAGDNSGNWGPWSSTWSLTIVSL